jgi:ATP-dependent exoDNAse (exonuclease V) alpha subunit
MPDTTAQRTEVLASYGFRSGAELLLVGDVDQLPSVGPGQVCRHH